MSDQKTLRVKKEVTIEGGKVSDPAAFSYVSVPVPTPGDNEAVVRVARAAVNPSDVLNVQGYYGSGLDIPSDGVTPGFEGSGVVVKGAGAGAALEGKRVGFFALKGGSWGPYVCVPAQHCNPLPDDVSFDNGASAFVNPLTVLGFFDVASGDKAIVQTAAASALGRMAIRHGLKVGVKVLNLVRRQDQADLCVKEGASSGDVVNTSDGDWKAQVTKWAKANGARKCFDAIGGSFTGDVLAAMPDESTVYVYGLLSGEPVSGVGADALIFQSKTVTGFWITKHLGTLTPAKGAEWHSTIANNLNTTFRTEVAASYPADKIVEALEVYGKKATGGKVCVAPNLPFGSTPLGSGASHASDTA